MPHSRRFIKRDVPQTRAYSPAVITQGGTLVFLAGQTVSVDAAGKPLTGDFDGQVRAIFAALGKTLEEAGGKLADMTTMTVFITDARYGDRFTQLREFAFDIAARMGHAPIPCSCGCRGDRPPRWDRPGSWYRPAGRIRWRRSFGGCGA